MSAMDTRTVRSISKRHHYVPQMILRNFVNKQGSLHCFHKEYRHPFPASPEKVFVETGLYVQQGAGADAKECELSAQIEGPVAPIVDRIVACARKGKLPSLKPDEKFTWDRFFYVQMLRTPTARADINDAELIRDVCEQFEKRVGPLSSTERAEFDGSAEKRQEAVNNAWIDSFTEQPQGDLFQALRRKGLLVLVLENPKKSFVVGSMPVLPMIPAEMILDNDEATNLFPVARDIAVACVGRCNDEELWLLPKGTQGTEILRKINKAIFKQSSIIASSSENLVDSLAGYCTNKTVRPL